MIRRQRILLTAVAVAGSVALYGCGGGDSGPDKTPFNQMDVDKAAADARKKAEDQAAAAAAAAAEAVTAAAEAKKAMEAADAAKKAAADAAKYAMTATLDKAKAMAASASASAENERASAAAKASRTAADKAATAASGHQAAKDAEASAKAAEGHAMEAAASAAAAKRSYQTARSLTADRHDTAGLATAVGAHAQTAMKHAETADDEAGKAKVQVKMAKDATTKKAAEDARTAAKTASDAAAKAAGDADDAAMAAEAVESDAAAVATVKTAARKHATDAMASAGKAEMYFKYTAGYADARKARDEANAGNKDMEKHADLRMRVPWIDAPTTKNAITALEDAAKAVRNAAESLERATDPDVITARQNKIASELTIAEAERTKVENDLASAMKVYDAAKPFSENGMGIDSENLASGKTLRHPSGRLSLNRDAVRVYAAELPLSVMGPYDDILTGRNYANPTGGVSSFGGFFTKPATGNTTTTHAKYQLTQYIRWGPDQRAVYKYASFGLWQTAEDAFDVTSNPPTSFSRVPSTEVNTFVFADMSKLSKNMPSTGSASYSGGVVSLISIYSGIKGPTGSHVPVITGPAIYGTGNLGTGARYDLLTAGRSRATIDFSTNKMDLFVDGWLGAGMLYDVSEITLDKETGTFSGGKYLGKRGDPGSRTNPTSDPGRISDPFKAITGTTAALVPTMKLHGGVFGPRSDEIAGTISLSVTVPHGAASADLETARDGWITVNTAFTARNTSLPSGG